MGSGLRVDGFRKSLNDTARFPRYDCDGGNINVVSPLPAAAASEPLEPIYVVEEVVPVRTSLPQGPLSSLDRYFHITERGSTVGTEIRGGLVTFFTMAYILVLNPLILGGVPDSTGAYLGGGGDLGIARIAAATALVAGLVSILMGVLANFPLALAAGLGLNAVVAYSLAALPGMTWADAMGIIVMEGLLVLILAMTGIREAVFDAVPTELKVAISVGIGLFITFIGLVDAGFVRIPASQATPVELGLNGSLGTWPLLVFAIGLMTVIVLYVRKTRGAILIGIIAATIAALIVEAVTHLGARTADNPGGWSLNVPALHDGLFQRFGWPDFSLLGNFSLLGSFRAIGAVAVILFVFTLMIADFFDTMGTMVAVGGEAGLLDREGNPPHTRRILIADSVGAIAGGMGSVSSNTAYIESAAGVGDGARTGLAAVVTGLAFLLSTFIAPLVAMIPYEAATPALVLVGFLMMSQIVGIDWNNPEIAIPAFLTIALMPFAYSITAGIGAGIIAYCIIKLVLGKARLVHPFLWVASILFLVYFLQGPIAHLLGVG